MKTTFHIRERLSRRGGNQFYRDKSIRATSTMCGSPVTSNDIRWNDKAIGWNDFVPCTTCAEIQKARKEQK